ncbi:hypothetical protein CsatB_028747 [Cannabis sativa]
MDNEGMNKRAKRISSSPSVSSMVGNDGDDDRILKLPDTLILHILSFLPTEEVVRTCILSKRWKLIWYSVPTIFFSNNVNLSSTMDTAKLMEWEHGLEKFYNYVDKYLEHRKKGMYFMGNSVVTSFKLEMKGSYQTSKDEFLDKWLAFAAENKVTEIYLTILELNWVQLDASHFNFPSLKTLSMETVKNSDIVEHGEAFKFLLGCPSLEKLQVQNYFFLRSDEMALRLQSLSLKFLELKDTVYDELQVEAINLESLVLCGASVHNINLSACKKIRNLSFYDTSYHCKPSLNALISQIPLLENLTLVTKEKYKDHVKISGQQLKSFNFMNCYFGPCNITIGTAPEFEYFCYEGYIDLSISIKPSNSLSGKIVIFEGDNDGYEDYDANWFTDMSNFLLNLNCSWNTFSLHVEKYESLIWPEKLKRICRGSPLLNWKHLKVYTNYSNPEIISDLKESLLWLSPSLQTLSINKKHIF